MLLFMGPLYHGRCVNCRSSRVEITLVIVVVSTVRCQMRRSLLVMGRCIKSGTAKHSLISQPCFDD